MTSKTLVVAIGSRLKTRALCKTSLCIHYAKNSHIKFRWKIDGKLFEKRWWLLSTVLREASLQYPSAASACNVAILSCLCCAWVFVASTSFLTDYRSVCLSVFLPHPHA